MTRRNAIAPSRFSVMLPVGALALVAASEAQAATPTFYNNLAAFQADVTSTVTDDYSNPGYVFLQSDAAMSAVIGETDYHTTGFTDWNIVSGATYCAGCNGSFQLSFTTTSVGTPVGVHGAGLDILNNSAPGYFAFITYGDGTTQDVALPPPGTFWGVAAPERVVSIHFGLSLGGATMGGGFQIDNLIVGDGSFSDSDCCTASPSGQPGCLDDGCEATVCAIDAFCCNNSWDDICAGEATDNCAICAVDVCGDGVISGLEECDDAGQSAACDADCTFASCGDAVVNMAAGETCDDSGESPTCDDDCTGVSCGDGVRNSAAGEVCDDGGESPTCDADCTVASCGDLVVNNVAGETCDDGGRSATCNADCTTATCGDGLVNATAGEACDGDGAGNPGETADCDDDCTASMCGDMVVNAAAGEDCDDGGESASCDDDCTDATCGDGTVNATADEECDDGNTDDGDGCSASCLDEGSTTASESSGGDSSGGGESTGGDSGVTDTAGTTGADGSTGADGGSASNSGTDGGDTSGGDSGGADGSTGVSSDTAGRGSGDSGCGCTTQDDRRGDVWPMFAIFGLGAVVRRRRR